jgi:hypothetical protein
MTVLAAATIINLDSNGDSLHGTENKSIQKTMRGIDCARMVPKYLQGVNCDDSVPIGNAPQRMRLETNFQGEVL